MSLTNGHAFRRLPTKSNERETHRDSANRKQAKRRFLTLGAARMFAAGKLVPRCQKVSSARAERLGGNE
jgi:hypothetical protein